MQAKRDKPLTRKCEKKNTKRQQRTLEGECNDINTGAQERVRELCPASVRTVLALATAKQRTSGQLTV